MENVKKISDHFWIFEEDGVRSFLFEGTKRAMLVDTGFGTLPLGELSEELTPLPIFVVNTHADKDHTGRNREFFCVMMHPAEMDRYQSSLPEGCFMEAVRPLWEGDVIDLGHWKFEVILTPGHTPGSIMLLERDKRMLISGDTIQDGMIFMFGPGRNMPAFVSSIQRVVGLKDAFDTIWPSHGSCPLKLDVNSGISGPPDIISRIYWAAQDLLYGRLPLQEPPWPMPCKKYTRDTVSFLY